MTLELRVKEAAKIAKVSRNCIRTYITKGMLPAEKVKNRYEIKSSELEKFLDDVKLSTKDRKYYRASDVPEQYVNILVSAYCRGDGLFLKSCMKQFRIGRCTLYKFLNERGIRERCLNGALLTRSQVVKKYGGLNVPKHITDRALDSLYDGRMLVSSGTANKHFRSLLKKGIEKEFISSPEMIAGLGISKQRFCQLAKNGKIKAKKMLGKYYAAREEYGQFRQNRKSEPISSYVSI